MFKSLKSKFSFEREFWKVIELLDWHYVGEDNNVVRRATSYLSRKPEAFILDFQQMLDEKIEALSICDSVKESDGLDPRTRKLFESEDTYLYTRCAIIAAGKKYYQSVLNNPLKIKENTEFKPLMDLPRNALFKKRETANTFRRRGRQSMRLSTTGS